jgi:hypothetical protein
VAGEDSDRPAQGLPAGARIERSALLDQLQMREGQVPLT